VGGWGKAAGWPGEGGGRRAAGGYGGSRLPWGHGQRDAEADVGAAAAGRGVEALGGAAVAAGVDPRPAAHHPPRPLGGALRVLLPPTRGPVVPVGAPLPDVAVPVEQAGAVGRVDAGVPGPVHGRARRGPP